MWEDRDHENKIRNRNAEGGVNLKENYQICSRCILDSTIPGIEFDDDGVCNFCKIHDELEKKFPLNEKTEEKLNEIVNKIKMKGKNKKYDCIVGLSGGTDSTFSLYLVKKLGLRPLAVHLDNGWNSEVAMSNIRRAVDKLDVDIRYVEFDWEEFKDLQISFLKASVPDAEIPTDVAIGSVLYQAAADEGVNYVIRGHNFRTEGLMPLVWSYGDGKYIENVHNKFGKYKLDTYQNLTISKMLYFTFVKGIKSVHILPYFDVSKKDARKILKEELSWNYYGGHHFESIYTRFVISDLLWNKFGIDKRKISLSASVRSGYISRNEALEDLEISFPVDHSLRESVRNRLGLSDEEFQNILRSDPKSFLDYDTYYPVIRLFEVPIKIACNLGIFPKIFYEKYFMSDKIDPNFILNRKNKGVK